MAYARVLRGRVPMEGFVRPLVGLSSLSHFSKHRVLLRLGSSGSVSVGAWRNAAYGIF